MTTLYRPVLIETAEQAEALPVGTVAVDASSQSDVSIRVQGGWHCTGYCLDFGGAEVLKHSDMIGDTALVPIEAEEEFSTARSRSKWSFDGIYRNTGDVRADDWDGPMQTRYVTPWEAS